MVRLSLLLGFGLLGLSAASQETLSEASGPAEYQCGKVNVMLTGLPHNHPTVISQGWDPTFVYTNLKADAARIIKAGYNLRVTFFGPEQKMSKFEHELEGIDWQGFGVGFGVRGAADPVLTTHFEELLKLQRAKVPKAELWFNYSPNSTLWALEKHFPLSRDCPPGKDLGYTEICDICTGP